MTPASSSSSSSSSSLLYFVKKQQQQLVIVCFVLVVQVLFQQDTNYNNTNNNRQSCTSVGMVVEAFSSVQSSSVTKNDRKSVQLLLEENKVQITTLKTLCRTLLGSDDTTIQNNLPYSNDVFYLRYCIGGPTKNNDGTIVSVEDQLRTTIAWRQSEQGQLITSAARTALLVLQQQQQQGSSNNNNKKWNNEPIIKNAPYANTIIGPTLISPKSVVTTTSSQNDLIYCIRAGSIDDTALMKSVTIDEMVNFFLYVKEINTIIADQRSMEYDYLIQIITCNDISGIKLLGGSSNFRMALSKSSQLANTNYVGASYNGPTLLFNLPPLVAAVVKLFTPLFPKTVTDRLKFQQGPLQNVTNLQLLTKKDSNEYQTFMNEIDTIVYNI